MLSHLLYENRIKYSKLNFIINLLIIFIVFLLAEIGRSFGIPEHPLPVSVVWPATGFSLAAILLIGFRVWPGILLGYFAYYLFHFFSLTVDSPIMTAMAVSSCALLQVLLAGYVIRRFNSPGYLNTVKDVLVFLFAGLFACMIAGTLGVAAFLASGQVPLEHLFYTWVNFWLEESFGIYIFTPLLVVWITSKPAIRLSDHYVEASCMLALYGILSFLSFYWPYPLAHFFLPLAVWASYRFLMHGATLSVFLIPLTAIILTSLGYGSFNAIFPTHPLLILVSFLEIIVFTSLILAAVTKERRAAWNQINNDNISLQNTLSMHLEELGKIHGEAFYKDKVASLGMLTFGIAKHIQIPLKEIKKLQAECLEILNHLRSSMGPTSPHVEKEMDKLEKHLQSLACAESKAGQIVEVVQTQSDHLSKDSKVKTINLYTFLEACLFHSISEMSKTNPDLSISVIKDIDKSISLHSVLPEDLAYAFVKLLEHSICLISQKRERTSCEYSPKVFISAQETAEIVEIVIRDNSDGVSRDLICKNLVSFIEAETIENYNNIGMSVAYDIIVHVHRGEIKVESKENEYFQITIRLPSE